jgi:hypothetical protein
MDPRGANARHDQVRAVGPVAGGAAAVPAEVMQLVAYVRHLGLMDDLPACVGPGISVNHRNEVRLLDLGALIQTADV